MCRRHDCQRLVQSGVPVGTHCGTSDPDSSCPATKQKLTHDSNTAGSSRPHSVCLDGRMREQQAMRVSILALSVLFAHQCGCRHSGSEHDQSRPVGIRRPGDLYGRSNPANRRSDRPRRGKASPGAAPADRTRFNTEANGTFDEPTRAAIMRWQVERGHPKTGFLDTLQHDALLAELVPAAHASPSGSEKSDDDHPARRRCSPSPQRWR